MRGWVSDIRPRNARGEVQEQQAAPGAGARELTSLRSRKTPHPSHTVVSWPKKSPRSQGMKPVQSAWSCRLWAALASVGLPPTVQQALPSVDRGAKTSPGQTSRSLVATGTY